MAMRFHRIQMFSPDQIRLLVGKTMFICGGMDPMGDTSKAVGKFKEYGIIYRIFEDAGHGVNHECADKVNNLLITYFRE
ncbi:MAG TPA: hypothetical protein VFD89_06400 [Clostridia bacterium]|nr:hypothetical protein [Clostridia bacterium]